MFPRSFRNEEALNLPKCNHHLALSTELVEDIIK